MNELQLYELLRSIFSVNDKIQGRFYILEGFGQDLNAEGLDDLLDNTITPTQGKPKYPLVGMTPPVEVPQDRFNRFKTSLYFVVQSYQNNTITQKVNNSSVHPIRYDWADMRAICNDFINFIQEYIYESRLENLINIDESSLIIRRFSNKNTDRLAGVQLSIDFLLAGQKCTYNTFPSDAISKVKNPIVNPHNLH